tara:strand:+ start:474 stop:878 length:405 start_codon:yes stop_codon:yes gene_type:complete
MEFEPPQKENKAIGSGQIHRAITSMPMAPYWEGLIANSKHVTFRTSRWKGPLNQSGEDRGRTVWTITPLSVIDTGKKLLVAVRSFQIDRTGGRVPRTDQFRGEITLNLGSYVDVVRQVAYKMAIPVKASHIEYV